MSTKVMWIRMEGAQEAQACTGGVLIGSVSPSKTGGQWLWKTHTWSHRSGIAQTEAEAMRALEREAYSDDQPKT